MKESVRLKLLRRNPTLKTRKPIKKKKKKRETVKLGERTVARGSYDERLLQGGINLPSSVYVTLVILLSAAVLMVLTNSIGLLVGICAGPCFAYYMFVQFPNARSYKRRREAIPQLPAFVDTLGASLGTGYTMEDAFKHAAVSLPNGVLKKEMQRAVKMLEKNLPIHEALDYLLGKISGREIISLVITIKLFSDMGGRVLTPFQRLGYKIRDQQVILERASRDLVGVKQAFYVIFGLAMFVPASLLVSDPQYILSALEHDTVKWVVQGAVVVQLVCFMLFKQFTAIRV